MRLWEPSGRQGWLQELPVDHTLIESRRRPSGRGRMSLPTGETRGVFFCLDRRVRLFGSVRVFDFAAHAGFEKRTCVREARSTNSY